jgi:hypothetical protein
MDVSLVQQEIVLSDQGLQSHASLAACEPVLVDQEVAVWQNCQV